MSYKLNWGNLLMNMTENASIMVRWKLRTLLYKSISENWKELSRNLGRNWKAYKMTALNLTRKSNLSGTRYPDLRNRSKDSKALLWKFKINCKPTRISKTNYDTNSNTFEALTSWSKPCWPNWRSRKSKNRG